MGIEDAEVPFSMLGDYRLPCVHAMRTTETRNEYKYAEKMYSFVAMNRFGQS